MEGYEIAPEWYRHAFGALYSILYAHRSVAAAGPEAEFAADQLGLTARDRVLDLCCGNGRHIVHLLNHTESVVGLDYSPELLSLARQTVGQEYLLVRGDMRAIPFVASFDAVTNFFTSFGYFPTEEENLAVVRGVAYALKPCGRFLIDYMNAAHVERSLVPQTEREHAGYRIRERRWLDSESRRVNKSTVVHEGDQPVAEFSESVRLYTPDEFATLLLAGGLQIDRMFGDCAGAALRDDRPRMICVGHKTNGL